MLDYCWINIQHQFCFVSTIICMEESVIIFAWYNLQILQGIDTFSTCPAQIVGFFKYESRGIPTPELIDNNLSLVDIKDQNIIDDTMYAVVHTATSYVSWKKMEKSFVMPFTLGHPKECVYLFFRTMEIMD